MMALLTFVFLAAVVGIFKPYVQQLGRKQFGLIAAAAFVGMMIVVPKSDAGEAVAADGTSKANGGHAVASAEDLSPAAQSEVGKWEYSESTDEMRGDAAKYATLASNNEVDLDFPYGETNGNLMIRRNAEFGLNVMFSVDKGQVLCHSFGDSYLSVKFDDGPIQRFRCADSSDGSTETAFIENEAKMLSGLKKARKTIVEAEFFQQGRQQFTFDTANLKWE